MVSVNMNNTVWQATCLSYFLTWKLKTYNTMKKLRKLYNRLYLWLHGCDNMCDSCPPELKIRCYEHKQKETNYGYTDIKKETKKD